MNLLIPKQQRGLHFAARPAVVARYLGQVLLVLGGLTCVPAAVALLDGAPAIALRHGAVVIVLLAAGGAGARLRAPDGGIQKNEALVVSALAFALPPFLMAFPLMGYGLSYQDALFEAISGVTTTGLSVVASVDAMPFAFHFARAWMQWVGGLGVIVLCIAFLIEPGTAARHLGFDRHEMDDLVGGAHAHARRALMAYGTVTVLGIFLLMALGMGAEEALVHAFAAVSTGGFSSHDASLAGIAAVPARFGVIALCFAGAVPFYVYYRAAYRPGPGRWGSMLSDLQLRALVVLTVALIAVLFGLLWRGEPADPSKALGDAVITAVSAQTTAGFATVPIAGLGADALGVLIAAMTVGGGFGSTAGGIKILRLLIVLRLFHLMLVRCSVPGSTHISARLGGRPLDPVEIEAAVAVVMGYAGVVFLSFLLFLAFGQPALGSLFEVTSAVGTVGLSAGLTGPALATPLKAVLCVDMLMGRVETIALIVLIFPPTWIGRRH